jgi:RNA polymerase sigma factor (sigma-70 family)
MPEEKDIEIWNQYLAGDKKAFEYIFNKYVQVLYRYGRMVTSDDELVKDCVQELFTKLFQNRSRMGKTDNIRLYLHTALKNMIINEINRQQLYDNILNTIEKEEVDYSNAETSIISDENHAEMQKRLDAMKLCLTERQREIIHYRFYDNLSIEKIAQLTKTNYQTTANTLQRALKKMREYYISCKKIGV